MQIARSAPPAKVLGLYSSFNMNAVYRLITPLRAIGGSWAPIDQVSCEQLDVAETVVIHGLGGRKRDVTAVFRSLRHQWKVKQIIIDYDDALFHPHPYLPVRMKPYQLTGVRNALKRADGVVVTNDYNREHFAQYTDAPISVVPNLIWPADWPTIPPPQESPPVIVLAGSPSHHYDWNLVVPALLQVRQQLPDVQLRLLGYGHPALKQIATQGGGSWMSGPEYIQALAGGAIGLCPLPDTAFNRGKSPVKALEYSLAAGMAVIASPCQYADLLADGRGRITKETTRLGWEMAIGLYLSDPALRLSEATALRAYILATRDARLHTTHLTIVYGA